MVYAPAVTPVREPPELLEPELLEAELPELELLLEVELPELELLVLLPLELLADVEVLAPGPEEPPHPPNNRPKHSNATLRTLDMSGARERLSSTGNSTPASSKPAANSDPRTWDLPLLTVVTVSTEVAAAELKVTVAGEKLQLAPVGSPEHDKDTLPAKPPVGVTVSVVVGGDPAASITLNGLLALSVKPAPAVPVTVTVDAAEVLGA